jgi:hypothetical protein
MIRDCIISSESTFSDRLILVQSSYSCCLSLISVPRNMEADTLPLDLELSSLDEQ